MLIETETVQYLWYTRREGTITGPFPIKQIRRYILLGRIVDSDELSTDKVTWKPLSELPELVPTVMKDADTPEKEEKLLKAKMEQDERKGERRNSNISIFTPRNNRRNKDRRRPEPAVVLEYRKFKSANKDSNKRNVSEVIVAGLAAGFVAVFGIVIVLMYQPNNPMNDTACRQKAGPNINWSNCQLQGIKLLQQDLRNAKLRRANLTGANLSGAKMKGSDLAYADLTVAKLKQADLSKANLLGTDLKNADLQHVNLHSANLSYANLVGAKIVGANLQNAKLDNAIWIDQRRCAKGSVGICK